MTNQDYNDIFRQMEHEMAKFTDEVFRGLDGVGRSGRYWQPHVDLHEGETEFVAKVELSGVKPEDINISLSPDDRFITISGVRAEAEAERTGRVRCHQLEIYFGPFERAIAIPQHMRVDRDAVKASYKEGFLFITLPKAPVEERPAKKIVITDEIGHSHEPLTGETDDRS